MRLVLDAGAFMALERNDPAAWRRYKAALLSERTPVSHGGVVGQVWRGGGPRQARLAKALAGVDVRPLDDELGRAAGALLARAGADDTIDAALVLLATDGDHIVTSDPVDVAELAAAADLHVDVVRS